MHRNQHRDLTRKGLQWNLLNQIFNQGTTLIVGIILARLLSPEEFGLIGMVTVITGFAAVINNFGMGFAIVQKKDLSGDDLSSVFWLNLILSIILAVIICLSATPISQFYEISALKNITYALSLPFLFSGLDLVQRSLLQRNLDFRRAFIINIVAVAASSILAIYLALTGSGVWSLVWKAVFSSFVATIMYWATGIWMPKMVFKRSGLREIVKYSIPLFGSDSLNYWVRNLDNLLIGKFLGSEALGYYGRAYAFMLMPVRQISTVISGVLFPSLSLIQDDNDQIKSIYLKISRIIAFITFPLMFGLAVVAEPFVLALLGEKWTGVIPVLQILAVLGATQSISTLNGNIFMAKGATKTQFKVSMISSAVMIIAIIIGLQYGITGVALAFTIASLLIAFPLFHVMGKLIDLGLKDIIINLWEYFTSSAVMAVAVYFIDQSWLKDDTSVHLRLLTEVIIGFSIYVGLNYLFRSNALFEIIAEIKKYRVKRSNPN